MRSKSCYYKFFMSFLMVLLAPMLTIFLIFMASRGIVRDQILTASRDTLNQFFLRVDEIVDEAQDICISIVNNQDSRFYSKRIVDQSSKRAFYTWKIKQQLAAYTGEKYFDIFEYYPSEDYVISANNASAKLDTYYELYYGSSEADYRDEFRNIAETPDKKPVLLSMNGRSSDSFLCIAMRQSNYKNEKYDYVLVAVLKPEYMLGLLESVENGDQKGISMIMNSNQKGIFSTNDIVYEDSFRGEDYVIQERQSRVIGVYYTYAVPNSYFWSKLFSLYVICGIGTAVSIILGIVIAVRQTDKVYRPVGNIVSELQRESAVYDAKTKTEFEFIKMLFEEEKKEKQLLNKTIYKGKVLKKTSFIFSLLNGSNEVPEKMDDIFRENGISLCSDLFCVALLQLAQGGSETNRINTFIVTNVFEELCNQECSGYAVALNDTKYAVLANLSESGDKEKLLRMLEKGNDFLDRHYGMRFTVGVSTVCEGMRGIHVAYEEAGHAIEYSFLMGRGNIIDYSETSGREFKYLQATELKMLYMVTDYLGDERAGGESAEWMVEDMLAEYEIHEEASMEAVQCFQFETVNMFYRILMQEGLWTEEWKQRVMTLLEQATLEDFKVQFARLLTDIYCKKQEQTDEQDVCAKVHDYIEEHYGEEQLSRTLLGELFGIAPGYLSRLFKEKYRFTIPEYISITRVDNAKQSLKNTNMSVQEIAKKSGFVNSASFIRTFKRQEGITPNVYREFSSNQ
jgi:two-component system response regulator YesN